MTCAEFTEIVHELLRPEQPANESVRRGLEHALLCDDCAAILAEQRELNDQLDDLADADRDLAAPADLERNLLAAFRAEHQPAPARPAVWRWIGALGLATAAVLIGAMLITHRPTDAPAGPAAQPATPRTSAPSMPMEASRVKPADPNAALDSAPMKTARASAQSNSASSQAQQAEQFYATPAAFDDESTDGDSVLRVELPESALASLGITSQADADSDDGSQMVAADVVVAEDGTLKAVRLAPQQDQNQNQQQGQDSSAFKF